MTDSENYVTIIRNYVTIIRNYATNKNVPSVNLSLGPKAIHVTRCIARKWNITVIIVNHGHLTNVT